MAIEGLFPIPLGFYNFNRPFINSEIEFISKLKTKENLGNTRTIDSYILNNIELLEIKKFIEISLDNYIDETYRPKNSIKFKITQSWCNFTSTNEFHHRHTHQNSIVSGVLYIKADRLLDKIYFFNNHYKTFDIPGRDFNQYNSSSWWYDVEPGKLILFPSYLEHMVEIRPLSDDTRISLSFNSFITGDLGVEENLTSLSLK